MSTFLFEQVVFGPIRSRRLGSSLGINLLPLSKKICSYNCIYCECGWTQSDTDEFIPLDLYTSVLEQQLNGLLEKGTHIDSITFAGNGEPTLHPYFPEIIDITLSLRNRYFPGTQISVLSNSASLSNDRIVEALKKTENPLMKLDCGSDELFQILNQPLVKIHLEDIIVNLKKFNGKLSIQTLLLKGKIQNKLIDNTSKYELELLASHLKKIHPHTLLLYSLDRDTPLKNLEKISSENLRKISDFLRIQLPQTNIRIY